PDDLRSGEAESDTAEDEGSAEAGAGAAADESSAEAEASGEERWTLQAVAFEELFLELARAQDKETKEGPEDAVPADGDGGNNSDV
ncbi:MAG: hypothetical protein Q4D81_09605, partial [Eubacteriales bacterium]|nr:hypothetical protein [Eubacteriales bacterium]